MKSDFFEVGTCERAEFTANPIAPVSGREPQSSRRNTGYRPASWRRNHKWDCQPEYCHNRNGRQASARPPGHTTFSTEFPQTRLHLPAEPSTRWARASAETRRGLPASERAGGLEARLHCEERPPCSPAFEPVKRPWTCHLDQAPDFTRTHRDDGGDRTEGRCTSTHSPTTSMCSPTMMKPCGAKTPGRRYR
jgi:hypothetical protein